MTSAPTSLSIFSLVLLAGCAQPADEAGAGTAQSDVGELRTPPALPVSWGGADPSRWRPEAVVANAASTALNAEWQTPGTRDVVVAIPVRMLTSDLFPYGDGQSNAAPSFEGWPEESRPPVVATLTRSEGTRITVRFDRTLATTASTIEVFSDAGVETVPAMRAPNGDLVATWTPPAGLAEMRMLVHPTGWNDWLPIAFDVPTKRSLRVSGLLDRERVAQREGAVGTVESRLRAHVFGTAFNGRPAGGTVAPYEVDDVHGVFPFFGRPLVTGVGRGYTWVADDRPQGYKLMYQCFDPRDAGAEASARDGGVPSGSGWHRIGDRAETVVNDLEGAPMVVGYARTDVKPTRGLPSGGVAWGLGDVINVRWLQHEESLVTPRGAFHWFAFSHAKRTCAEIVVSPESATLADFEP